MRLPRVVQCMLLAMLLVPAVPAWAQIDRVAGELETTDRRIERAQSVVSDRANTQAQDELAEAGRVQANARTAMAQGHPRIAIDLTYRARAHADRAIALISRLPDPDRVLAQLQRTRELIDRARDRMQECTRDPARAMLGTASDMQDRADEAGQAGRYLAAIQLTLVARERAHQALRLCDLSDNAQEGAARALQRTDNLIQRAHDQAGLPDVARGPLQHAVELQARAWQEYRDQHYESSLRSTLSARTFAFRAARLSGSVMR